VPEAPGLGVEIDERVAAAHPFAPETHEASEAVLEDGTIVDW
jgi:galactonate dehydratase